MLSNRNNLLYSLLEKSLLKSVIFFILRRFITVIESKTFYNGCGETVLVSTYDDITFNDDYQIIVLESFGYYNSF